MAKSTKDRQPPVAQDTAVSAGVLSVTHARYLRTVRTLSVAYHRTCGAQQRRIFLRMIHTFMQELCGYPPTSYLVTTAAAGTAEVGSSPHVITTSSLAALTLFYFTASENPDDVQELWMKHAQVYLMAPHQGAVAAEDATAVVWTNFFMIDGARKDPTTGAWKLWSAFDIPGAQGARVDLRSLELDTEQAVMTSRVIQQQLQRVHYQLPSTLQAPDSHRSAARAEGMPAPHMENRGA
jgi:hypothetical protein